MKLFECVDKETKAFDCFSDDESNTLYLKDEKGNWLGSVYGHMKKVEDPKKIQELDNAEIVWWTPKK
jgi:hypothetical protein